ncbi:hypothetical protein KDL01_22205 [Actinospica durhamensis]|uniref:Uncharacterized protein n=1 Tax=Actinospica durhamensis TaxID=1508375 RepID=A0A941ERA5_9ACTN|nr:DUF6886 family protein [Actinospica durhamensis]MBR7836005.1 hypothetical protein [Actinospica durhamensis]
MRPEPGQVLHFSEDPTITAFKPHVARTAQEPDPYVWAVTWDRAPDYWFPRQCPRAMAWTAPWTTAEDARAILGPGHSRRVHAVEYGWLDAMREATLYAYRFAAEDFHPIGDPKSPHAMVSDHEVTPLAPPERVGDLFALHGEAGIELRVLPNLWPFWDGVIASTLDFSGIRMRNARSRP